MPLLSLGIILYLIATLFIGLAAMGFVKNGRDFITSGRRMPLALNTAALFALWFGSETVLGASGTYAGEGLQAVIEDPFGAALCLFLIALIFARPLYRLNLNTLGDLFDKAFGSRFGMWASLGMVATFFSYAAGQFVALGLVVGDVLGVPHTAAVTVCAALVAAYTMSGGLWAVSLTDLLQGLVIVAGLLVASYFATSQAGGFEAVMAAGEARHFRFWPESDGQAWVSWVGAWLVIGLGSIPSQDVFQRFNSARSERSAVAGMWLGGALYLIFSLLPLYLSLAALKLGLGGAPDPDHTQGIVSRLIRTYMPEWVQILYYGALLSAILSTASGALLAPAALLSENILPRLRLRGFVQRSDLALIRLSVAGVALLGWGMALWKNNIFHLVSLASALGLAGLFVPLCAALFHRKPSRAGAHLAFFAGFSVYLVMSSVSFPYAPEHVASLTASALGYLTGVVLEGYFHRALKPDERGAEKNNLQ